jgi:Sec-independent protein translocase protein TatA
MFGIGLGELVLILFLLFLISPKDLPKLLRKLGRFLKHINTIRDEITHTGNSLQTDKQKKSMNKQQVSDDQRKRTDS